MSLESAVGRLERILNSRRLILSTTALIVLFGALSYLNMPRQEDPFFPYRGGVIRTVFPGADAERIRQLVVRHLERELAEISDLDFVRSTVRNNVALTTVVMLDTVYETESKWDEVRRAMARAQLLFPAGVEEPTLDDRVITTSTATYAIVGSDDLAAMTAAAKVVRDRLTQVGDLIRIDMYGDPGEQVTIALEDETAKRYKISAQYLAQQLEGRMQLLGSGTLVAAGTRMTLKPETEFRSIDELRSTPIRLPNGDIVPLASMTEVWLGHVQPSTARMWHDGEPAVLVDVIAVQNSIDTVAYGERVRAAVDEVRAEIAPLKIEEMFFQPDRVKSRLDQLSGSLMLAVGIILGVLVLAMGPRLAALVAVILPTVAAMSLAVYAISGGVLHQMAVIGMIVALGILVDNAIVMIEEVQWQLNRGVPPIQSAINAIRNLAKPLAAATGTTVAAFIPMALSKGGTGDFTRAVPTMIIISLLISYAFAIVVTPMLGETFLRPKVDKQGKPKTGLPEWIGRLGGGLGSQKPWMTLAVAGIVCGISVTIAAGQLKSEFFPQADRDQILVDIELSEGTIQEETTRVARILERKLRHYEDVLAVHGFIGNSGPRFYYNLLRLPDQPNRARLVVQTSGIEGNLRIIAEVREFSRRSLPEAKVVAKILSQGPPFDAPIEVRVFNPDPVRLAEATELLTKAVQNAAGAINVSHNLGLGAPQIDFEIDDAQAMQYGLTRAEVAQALLGRSQGIPIGTYRAGDEPVPIRVRSLAGENYPPSKLDGVLVFNHDGEGIPLEAVTSSSLAWHPGAIYSWNQRRYSLVSAELDFGFVFSEVMDAVQPLLAELDLPPGTEYEFGGEAEASGEANSAIAGAAPIGVVLLLFFLVWQFNSFRRLSIVMMTIPLAFVGVVVGLAVLGIPFGFQPLLGCIALIGIVVNNAIVLIDVLDQNLAEGQAFNDAMTHAVERRTRPILLTTATTIAGLVPLAFSSSTMWPPMAWPIITGLLTSTILTLFVVPALCRLLLAWRPGTGAHLAVPASAACLAVVGVLLAMPVHAEQPKGETAQVSLESLMHRARHQPLVEMQRSALDGREALEKLERRAAWMPQLSAVYTGLHSDSLPEIQTPQGNLQLGEHMSHRGEVQINQPLLNPARGFFQVPAAERETEAQALQLERAHAATAYAVAQIYVQHLQLQTQQQANRSLESSFAARLERMQNMVAEGRALEADALDVRLARNQVRQALAQLDQKMRVLRMQLSRLTGVPVDSLRNLPRIDLALAVPDRAEAFAMARSHRADLLSLAKQIEAVELKVKGVRAQALPNVGAQFAYIRADGDAIGPDEDVRASVQVRWSLFSGGTRSAQADALRAERQQLILRRDDLLRQIQVDVVQAYENFELAQTTRMLADAAVESAEGRLKTRSARFDAGRETIDEVLDAEAQLRLQETAVSNASYAKQLAGLEIRLALGVDLLESLVLAPSE